MKKRMAVMAALLGACLLTACGGKNLKEGIPAEENGQTDTADQTDVSGEIEEKQPVPVITLKDYSKNVTSGEAVVLRIIENLPQVSFPENKEVEKIIQDYYDQEKKEYDPIRKQFKNQCMEEYDIQEEASLQYWQGHEISRQYKIGRVDANCVSIERDDYKDAGEDGLTASSYAHNFDTTSGLPLLMVDVFTSEREAKSFFTQKVIEVLSQERYQDMVLEDLEHKAEEVFTDDTWYFSATGVGILCNPGVVTKEDSQVIEIEVPYQEVTCLEKRFLPE